MTQTTDRVAIVTGASLGLGRAIAEHFVAAGYTTVITARSSPRLLKTAEEIGRDGRGRVVPMVSDAGNGKEADALIDAVAKKFGRIDVLVNNAGIHGPVGPVQENDENEWLEAILVNLVGPFRLIRKAVPVMNARGGGKIINISGGGAVKPMPTFSAYSASKAGLVRMTESLAYELAPLNIQINAIAPGFIASRIHDPIVSGEVRADPAIAESTRRDFARGGQSPNLAATLCLFLASDQSNHITGRLISAVFDDRDMLKTKEPFVSKDFFTLRRIDNIFVIEKPKQSKP